MFTLSQDRFASYKFLKDIINLPTFILGTSKVKFGSKGNMLKSGKSGVWKSGNALVSSGNS